MQDAVVIIQLTTPEAVRVEMELDQLLGGYKPEEFKALNMLLENLTQSLNDVEE